jgi:hypothetical protein
MKDFFKSLFGRRVLIPVAIILLLGVFLALYYFVYTPKQQAQFNKKAFRILAHISNNFQERIQNYSTAIFPSAIKNDYIYKQEVRWNDTSIADSKIKEIRKPVAGKPSRDSLTCKFKLFRNDSMIFSIPGKTALQQNDSGKSIKDILEPLIDISNSIFESVVLIQANNHIHTEKDDPKVEIDSNLLLYKSGNFAVDRGIIIDSLVKYNGAFLFPVLEDITVQGDKYKLFLSPFRINNQRYLLGGFISQRDYKILSQDFPIEYLAILGVIILISLLSLPFLKIFLIGLKENITIKDLRAVIAMLFIIPFLFILALGAYWIYTDESNTSTDELKTLHNKIAETFRQEIAGCLEQLTEYEELNKKSEKSVREVWKENIRNESSHINGMISLRDLYFYPASYKNMDGVFWINDKGVEIEKWNYVNIISPYLYLSERQYFKNIKSGALETIGVRMRDSSGKFTNTQTLEYSIQPTLSKATGNYTVNVVKKTSDSFLTGKAILMGISAKMYSVYKPVLPKGYNFCLVNNDADVLFHSESDRSLQENLFDAGADNKELRTAITNRDSVLLETDLYDRKVKVLITPVEGVPYQLVTYYNKRNDYLFAIHITAFTFLVQSLMLVGLTIFILLFYYITRKHSKLFFSPDQFEWLNPGHEKVHYYKALIYFQLLIIAAVYLGLLIVSPDQKLNFIMQAGLLLPFAVATGYYMFRSSETIASISREVKHRKEMEAKMDERKQKQVQPALSTPVSEEVSATPETRAQGITGRWNKIWAENYFKVYISRIIKIFLAYLFVLVFYTAFKDGIEEKTSVDSDVTVNVVLWMLLLFIPLGTAAVSTSRYLKYREIAPPPESRENGYLKYLGMALMLSVFLISIFPTISLLIFAHEQENTLATKSSQMQLAKKIQEHRSYINERMSKAKFQISHPGLRADAENYGRQLKFNPEYGNYYGRNTLIQHPHLDSFHYRKKYYNSVLYKGITDYLFLPDDHFDFYNNTKDYFWAIDDAGRDSNHVSVDKLSLYYNNESDQQDRQSISLSAIIPHNLPLMRKFDWNSKLLFVVILSVFVWALYSLFNAISRRVFLIGYFEGEAAKGQDSLYLDKILKRQRLNESEKIFWETSELNLALIKKKEGKCHLRDSHYAEWILKIQTLLAPSFEAIWKSLELHERSVLYDFALDGFTNYRNIGILFSLYHKGIIQKKKYNLRIMSDSFRNFLISKTGSGEIRALQQSVSEGGKWGNLRVVFYIVLLAILFFLFITKEEISKQMVAIVSSLAALIPLLLKLFDPFSPAKGSDK